MISQITDYEIECAKEVQKNFVVQTVNRASALESGIFAILNQASPWERPSSIIYKLREASYPGDPNARSKYASLEILQDIKKVNKIAKDNGWRFHHEPRLESFIENYARNEESWWQDIVLGNERTRDQIIQKISYISMKTFSFWHLCLGGTNLLPLDIHVRRQLASLGVRMKKDFYEHTRRPHHKKLGVKKEINCDYLLQVPIKERKEKLHSKNSQLVVDEPDFKQYKKIERSAKKLFSNDSRFIYNEQVNMGLVASVLWWRGANRGEPNQANLFHSGYGGSWRLPYGI